MMYHVILITKPRMKSSYMSHKALPAFCAPGVQPVAEQRLRDAAHIDRFDPASITPADVQRVQVRCSLTLDRLESRVAAAAGSGVGAESVVGGAATGSGTTSTTGGAGVSAAGTGAASGTVAAAASTGAAMATAKCLALNSLSVVKS